MGWENFTLGGQHEMFHDTTLLNVAQMIVAKWRCGTAPCHELSRYLVKWHRQWEYHAPGVVDIQLEEIYEHEPAKVELLNLLEQVEAYLIALGPSIPKEVMRAKWPISGVAYTGDQDTAQFLDVVQRLKHLLKPEDT